MIYKCAEYTWYKNGRVIVKSRDDGRKNHISRSISQEYYDDYIGGRTHYEDRLDLYKSSITTLSNIKTSDYSICLNESMATSLGDLENVGGSLDLSRSKITSLDKLKTVGSNLILRFTSFTSLGALEHVGGKIFCNEGGVTHDLLMNSKFKDQVAIEW